MAKRGFSNIGYTDKISRRDIIRAAASMAAGGLVSKPMAVAQQLLQPKTVRDRLWLFGVPTNADNFWTHQRSVMTPAEGAHYLGVPNVIMVEVLPNQLKQGFLPFQSPLAQYEVALRPFDRVLWSITGAGGFTSPAYRSEVLDLSVKSPNCVGLYMDDFFYDSKKQMANPQKAALTVDELKQARQKVLGSGKKMEIWATFYTHLLGLPLDEYLSLIDVLTIWTWKSSDLETLPDNLKRIDALGPHLKKTLGCYFFDYTTKQPFTVEQMKYQCELGLEWMRQGKIEGLVFEDNPMEDLGYESVEWTRNWIRNVGDTVL